ncbi:MAG: hypothetical protein IPG66_02090 [Hydrogenophilales bacterium]|nr:hypothetical protein [Hydrogenophilales bacterium]
MPAMFNRDLLEIGLAFALADGKKQKQAGDEYASGRDDDQVQHHVAHASLPCAGMDMDMSQYS